MRLSAIACAAWIVAASAIAFAAPPAAAQDADGAVYAASPTDPTGEAPPPPDTPLTPDEAAMLGNALLFDPANSVSAAPVKPLHLPSMKVPNNFDISHTDKPDGSKSLVLKQPLADDWDAKVGADLSLATAPSDLYRPSKPLPVTSGNQDSGTAWASVGMSNLATVDARVDPGNNQGKLGTTLKRSIPVGSKFFVTLQSNYSVTETFSASTAAPSDVPLMTAPAATTLPTPQIWGSEKDVKFDILSTGTTFGAGIVTASNDPVTHNTLSADQKLYGPLHVTTAVTDVGQATASKSITAGLKLNW